MPSQCERQSRVSIGVMGWVTARRYCLWMGDGVGAKKITRRRDE